MRQWNELSGKAVRENRQLFNEFRNDYLITFGKSVNINCGACWLDYWYNMNKFLLNGNKMENKTDYILFPMYNGIQFKNEIIRQGDMTNKKGARLVKEHPHGAKLFSSMPKVEVKATKKQAKATPKKAEKTK